MVEEKIENSDRPKVSSSSSSSSSSSFSLELKSDYQNLIKKAANFFPKVNQNLILDILKLETTYKDWKGSVILEIKYPEGKVELDTKINKLYDKYERSASEKDERTLRFKALHMNIEELENLLKEDPEIEYISGSAEHSAKDEFPSMR